MHKLESILDIYQKFTGDDPRKMPMRIYPAIHYTMGGAWVDWPAADDSDREERYRQMTNIEGCFNIGESDFAYHGANRLGANSLLSCIFSGLIAGVEAPRYVKNLDKSYKDLPSNIFEDELHVEEELLQEILRRDGGENIHELHDELSKVMVDNVTVKRNNKDLLATIDAIKQLRERSKRIHLDDTSRFANQTFQFAAQFAPMLEIALVITKGALLRDEFRGAHFKPEFPERDDENWLKTTIATYKEDEPNITYKPVDLRHLQPVMRDYTKAKKVRPELKNVPENIRLPI